MCEVILEKGAILFSKAIAQTSQEKKGREIPEVSLTNALLGLNQKVAKHSITIGWLLLI